MMNSLKRSWTLWKTNWQMKKKNFMRMRSFFMCTIIFLKLEFENHIKEFCLKVGKKINALCHISSYMALENYRSLMKAFIESQFNYCPLIWMLRSRTLNNKINQIHEKALRPLYSDYNSFFYEVLDKDYTFTIHQKMSKIKQMKFINAYMAYLQQY